MICWSLASVRTGAGRDSFRESPPVKGPASWRTRGGFEKQDTGQGSVVPADAEHLQERALGRGPPHFRVAVTSSRGHQRPRAGGGPLSHLNHGSCVVSNKRNGGMYMRRAGVPSGTGRGETENTQLLLL